jgi:hypothetical protein
MESPKTWTEEEAERVVFQDEGLSEKSDEELLEEQDDDGVDIKVVVQKVRFDYYICTTADLTRVSRSVKYPNSPVPHPSAPKLSRRRSVLSMPLPQTPTKSSASSISSSMLLPVGTRLTLC